MSYFPWMQRGKHQGEPDMIESERDRSSAGFSRRSALKALAVGGAAAVAGGIPLTLGTSRTSYAASADKVKMLWAGGDDAYTAKPAACHAPIAFAVEKGIYGKHNLDVAISFHGLGGGDLIDTIASGEVDLGAHLLVDWLKPLQEKPSPVRFISGMHGGCQRLLASKASKITKVEDLKGKTIAVGGIDNVAELAFLVTLAKSGLDPNADVKWVEFPYDQLGEVVNSGKADALATLDVSAYIFEKKYDLLQLADTQTHIYDHVLCCGFAANDDFLTNRRDVARRVTAANADACEYTAAHPEEVATFYVEKYKPGVTADELAKMLGYYTYHLHPTGPALTKQTVGLIDDMKLVKRLPADLDSAEFAKKITDNIDA
jgi:NitT/TauT family transport system substrate-binding protein